MITKMVKRLPREYGYLTLQMVLSIFAFTYFFLFVGLGAGLAVTVVGGFVAALFICGARGWGKLYRRMDESLLDSSVTPPPDFVAPKGFWAKLGAMLSDGTGWRTLLYMFLSFPLALFTWVISTVFLTVGLGAITYPFWWRALPENIYHGINVGRGMLWSNNTSYFVVNTPGTIALMVLAGLALLALWIPITHAFAHVFRLLGQGLLGATKGSIRVAQLRTQRATILSDSDARLRQIERDLHDGTQAQLTAIAMQIGEARETLAAGGDPVVALGLLDTAHSSTKGAMTDLRDIARGIRPAALDAGLTTAVQTLAARSALPVAVEVFGDVDGFNPTVRAAAYYAVTELVNNATKHGGASHVTVTLRRAAERTLLIEVADDGVGGARVVPEGERLGADSQTGLAALADRVAALDGTMLVDSPTGGPTNIILTLNQ